MFEIFNKKGTVHTKAEELVETLVLLKAYAAGELELDLEDDGNWYAKDYRADYESALELNHPYYANNPLISDEYAEKNNIDVRVCCDKCDVSYVG